MPEDKLKILYDAVSKDYDIGSIDDFKSKLSDPEKRKAFYDGIGAEYDLGTYDDFEGKIDPVKKKSEPKISLGYSTATGALQGLSKSGSLSGVTKSESSQGKTGNIPTPKIRRLPNAPTDATGVAVIKPPLTFDRPAPDEYASSIDEIVSNAIGRGQAQAEEADILTATSGIPDPKAIQTIANTERRKEFYPTSQEYADFHNAKGWQESLGALVKSPAKILTELTLESMTALASHGAKRMAAGAAAGSFVPGVGTATGAIIGSGLSSLNLEYSGKVLESLQENGVNLQDPQQLKNAFENDDLFSKIRSDALKKGVPIALFDMLSFGLAGRIASKPAKTILKKVGQYATETGVQSTLGGAGEIAGELASGEDLNPSAILGEMVGEIGGGAPEVITGVFLRKSKNGTATTKDVADAVLANPDIHEDVDLAETSGQIDPQSAGVLKKSIQDVRLIDSRVPKEIIDPEIRSQAITMISERTDIDRQIAEKQAELENTDEAFRPIKEQEIKNLILQRDETNKQIADLSTLKPEENAESIRKNEGQFQEGNAPETSQTESGPDLQLDSQEKPGNKEIQVDTKAASLKDQLVKGGKITLDEKGNIEDIQQNSGAPSDLFRDLTQISGDKQKAAEYYLGLKEDQGPFKTNVADWENKIMQEYGRSGHEYSIERPDKNEVEGHENDYAWSSQRNGKPVIFFNDKFLSRDIPFNEQKQGFIDRYITPEIQEYEKTENTDALKRMQEYRKFFEKNIQSNRDLKLHLIHDQLYGIMNTGKQITPEDIDKNYLRSVHEIERLNQVPLAKDYFGEPAIYATGAPEGITKFKKPGEAGYKKNDPLTGQEGIYFSRDIDNQEKYAGFSKGDKPGEGRDLYYAFLRYKKPYYLDDPQAQAQYPIKDITNISTEQKNELQKLGYDAVIKSSVDRPKEEVVVFEPEQVEIVGTYRKGLLDKNIVSNDNTDKNERQEKGQKEDLLISTPAGDEPAVELSSEQKNKDNQQAQEMGWQNAPHAIKSISKRSGTEYKTWEEIPDEIKQKISDERKKEKEKTDQDKEPKTTSTGGVVQPESTGISHEETAKLRQEFGIPEYETSVKKQEKLESDARSAIKDKYPINDLIARLGQGAIPTDVEHEIMKLHIAGLADKVAKNPTEGNILEARMAIEAYDMAGTAAGRSLAARRGLIPRDETLLDYFMQDMDANLGAPLTDAQRQITEKEFKEIQQAKTDLEKKIAQLEKEHNRSLAQKTVNVAKSIKSSTKKTHADYVAERKQISEDIRAKLKKARTELNTAIIPYVKELTIIAPDVAKMVRSYVAEGVTQLEEIVNGIHDTLKEDISDITKEDVTALIAGKYNEKKATKSEIAQQLFELRQEAKLIAKLEELNAGKAPLSEKKKVERNIQIEALKKQIKQHDLTKLERHKGQVRRRISELEQELSGPIIEEPVKKESLKLDKEAIDLKDKYIRLKQEREIRLLKQKYANRDRFERLRDFGLELLNIPRTIKASMDFSAPFRQGLLASVGNPGIALRAFGEMFIHAFSQQKFDQWFYDVKESPVYSIAKESGLYIADPHDPKLSAKEETFMNNLVERIPLIGTYLIKGSERAYVSYLNKLRWDIFNQFASEFEEQGRTFQNSPALYKGLADYINNATGRGDLHASIEKSAPFLNAVFFAPRLIASRLNLLTNFANPNFYRKVPAPVRKMYFKDMAKLIGAGFTVLALAKLGGADVEDDPRSTDFGKIKIGNTRYDIWGGFQQYVRFFAQLFTGQTKSAMTGKMSSLDGKGPFGRTRSDVIETFARSKLAPAPALGWNLMSGRNIIGEPVTPQSIAEDLVEPLILKDLLDAWKEQGAKSLLTTGLPATFGIGVSTYEPRHDKYKK